MNCESCKGYEVCNQYGDIQKSEHCNGPTNFAIIAKNEAALTIWLNEKLHFCSVISCDECVAKDECYSHESNDTEDYTNEDLWYAWLTQPHREDKPNENDDR